MERISVISLAEKIETEADAYIFLERLRWADQPVCSHCGSTKVYFLTPKNGVSRQTRTGSTSQRRVWKCGSCRKQFSVLTGTIFESTKISLRKWLFVLFEMVSNKSGIAAREIERKYHLTAKSAWFMTQRIREAMKREPLAGMLAGTIEADETWIGGKPRNRHQQGRQRPGTSKGYAGTPKDKIAVLSLINRETGEVRSRVVPDVTGASLKPAIDEQVDKAASRLNTDAAPSYRRIGQDFQSHEWVEHSAPRLRVRPGDGAHEHGREVLLPAQAVDRRDAPPRQPGAPRALLGRVRLPLLVPQDQRHGAAEPADRQRRRAAAHLPPTRRTVNAVNPA